ncbi:PREDICTED: uncharacterized protein LOC108745406 [Trachymyrmex septentrionalis]|uniref:uncharacterized protein LOC108745406 n=1 Tax=Trachymyrmex septentrionalis TaxID=34720 RepID=UPI00084F2719|nr:PREDICTED: uncharacterized protein LOC108745406 [Trachymyrmex septentrionalis]
MAIQSSVINHEIYVHCKPNDWIITNVIIKSINEMKKIGFNITYNGDNYPVYTIEIKMNSVDYNNYIIEESKSFVKNIEDCKNKNLSQVDKKACKIANTLAMLE